MATLAEAIAERERRKREGTPEPRGLLTSIEDVIRSVAQGGAASYMDEAAAFMANITGIGGTPGATTYEEQLAGQRARDEEIPLATRIGGEIVGALANPLTRRLGISKIPGWLNAVFAGGRFGGVYGFGAGEGGLEERTASAGGGAALGAGGTALLYPAIMGGQRLAWRASGSTTTRRTFGLFLSAP